MTPNRDAKKAWTKYYNAHNREQVELTGELAAAWSKLEEYAARFALVVHFVRRAAEDASLQSASEVDAQSMGAGIRLAQWFKHEALRVYALLAESEEERTQRQLIEWIERKGGGVKARQVQQGNRRYVTAEDAEGALDELVKANYGVWEPSPPGRRGKPTRRFKLTVVYDNTLKPLKNSNNVNVDNVDNPKTQLEDEEWGEL